ncbi:MAG: glycosyltransferase family 4 protein [Elusimicrobia bacterium]|nr:glycosyltransferase family 4 protein [Elusimicrobiota bacterium]
MSKIVFIGSHLGYPMDRTPLGGGAMVGMRLVEHWSRRRSCELAVLGSGPVSPAPGSDYARLPEACAYDPVRLSELQYARFCRDFESATTRWLLERRGRFAPCDTCVLVNDVAEGPTLGALARAGYPIVSLWHVDVVDYFNKLYLHGLVSPERLTRLYERCRSWGLASAVPDLLRVVFEKQSETVARSARLIVPSRGVAETLNRCYDGVVGGPRLAERIRVVPWGAFAPEELPAPAPESLDELRARYGIGPDTLTLITLSRIAPEKGIHILIEALRRLQAQGRLGARPVVLLICGEAAFMQGSAYSRRIRAAAAGLRGVRVNFPGYLDERAKRAHLAISSLFVSPSVHESYGLTVVEAMQAGLPVLASDHYGVRDILDGGCGRVAPYASLSEAPDSLAQALSELVADPGRLAGMGRLARERAAGMPFSAAADAVLEECRRVLEVHS